MTTRSEHATRRVRRAALLLIAGLVAGPVSTHVYWLFGGTWGLYDRSGAREDVATTGVRVVAAIVIVLLVAAILVVLARIGLWQQEYVSARLIRIFAWALAAVFLLEALAGFTWSRGEPQWWLYAPIALVLALLALVVADAGGRRRIHRPHRMLPLH
jgi:cytochrome bd-type quinol oxidase subunit 2